MRAGGVAGKLSGGTAGVGRKCGSAFALAMGKQAYGALALVGWSGDAVSELRLLLQRGEVRDRRVLQGGHGFLDAGVDLVLDRLHRDTDRVLDGESGR